MLSPSVKSVPTVARLCSRSSTRVPRDLSFPSFRVSSSNNLLPTSLAVTTAYSGRVSHVLSFRSSICHCSSSSSSSPQETKSSSVIDAAINSVVKIFSICPNPNSREPWVNTREHRYTGSGFVISRRRILTSAHILDSPSPYVQVRKHGSSTMYEANVEVVGHECDLAILVIDSEEFWEDMNPLELGDDDLPFTGDTVSIIGYDSDTIALAKGTVRGVDYKESGCSSTKLMTIEIEAYPATETNGGPAFIGNNFVGSYCDLAGSFPNSGLDYGYIIPAPIIKHFLNGVVESGQYIGFGSLDISYQCMEDAQLRRHFKLSDEMTGILINEIHPPSYASKVLKDHDVMLAIDGVPIGNDGTVPLRGKERVNFNHLLTLKKPGETTLVKILRDGREHEFRVGRSNSKQPLITFNYLPSYYILAGFVFVPLSVSYIMHSFFATCSCILDREAKKSGEQIVIISQVLLDDITSNYDTFRNFEVKKVNGVEVVNLKHLSELIETCCTEDLRLTLEEGYVIVLDNKSAKEATSSIIERYGIPSAMSKDLQRTNYGHVC